MALISFYITTFWTMQIAVAIIFKYGADAKYWIPYFIIGNIIGITATRIWMLLMEKMNPNIATAMAAGGAFFLQQVGLALVFHTRLTAIQMLGIAAIITGMLCLCLGGETRAGA